MVGYKGIRSVGRKKMCYPISWGPASFRGREPSKGFSEGAPEGKEG